MKTTVKMHITTNLVGLKKNAWRKNLNGHFVWDGRELTDAEVRRIVEYGISKGYRTEADIPQDEIVKILNQSDMNIQEEILAEAIKRYPKDLNSHEKFIEGAKWATEVYLRNAELKMLQEESAKFESRLGKEALLNYLKDKLEE